MSLKSANIPTRRDKRIFIFIVYQNYLREVVVITVGSDKRVHSFFKDLYKFLYF